MLLAYGPRLVVLEKRLTSIHSNHGSKDGCCSFRGGFFPPDRAMWRRN